MIDSHCHLEHMKDAGKVIELARHKMAAIVTSVPDPRNFEKTMKLVEKNRGFVFAAAGFHPEHVDEFSDEQIEDYLNEIRANADRLVSIGEIGLDYFWIKDSERQKKTKKIFEKFISLALEMKKPMTIHARSGAGGDGISETIEMLKKMHAKNVMMHCFSGTEENLRECLDQGWYISYATIIVRSKRHQRLAKATPIDMMLLDTDAPWLDPDAKPGSGELTNMPWKIEMSAEVIAKAKGISKKEVLDATEENAKKFFRLDI